MVSLEHKKDFAEERRLMAKCSQLLDSLKDSVDITRYKYSIRMLEAGMYVAEAKWDSLEQCILSLEKDVHADGKADDNRYALYIL